VHVTVNAIERRVDIAIEIEMEVEEGMTTIAIEVRDGHERDRVRGVSIRGIMIESGTIAIGRGVIPRWMRLSREIEAPRGAVKKISEVTRRYIP